ncbi:MAG: hypothetical protein AAF995_00510 [Planctomycetota bacterium]
MSMLNASPAVRPLVLFSAALLAGGGLVGCGTHAHKGPRGSFTQTRVMSFDHAGPLSLVSRHGRIDAATHATPMPRWAIDELDDALPSEGLVVVAIVHADKADWLANASIEPVEGVEGMTFDANWDDMPAGDNKRYGVEYVVRGESLSDVHAMTGFGDVRVAGVDGPVLVETDFGDVDVETVTGPANIYSDFGDLSLIDIEGPIEARTDFGDVSLRPMSRRAHPMIVYTDFGDIDVDLPLNFAGELMGETDFGDVRFRGADLMPGASMTGRNSTRTMTQGDGPRSTLTTDFGDVTVRFSD